MLTSSFWPTTVLFLATLPSHSYASPASTSPSLLKRAAPNFKVTCNNYPEVKQGWNEALEMAAHAAQVLVSKNPYAKHVRIRAALWGDERKTSTSEIIQKYQAIAAGPPVTIHCGEPPGYTILGRTCQDQGFKATLHGYRTLVGPKVKNPREEFDLDTNRMHIWGFEEGSNIVLCDTFLSHTVSGYSLLSDMHPVRGSNIDHFKTNWASFFVHELSHIEPHETNDDAGYGFEAAKTLGTVRGKHPIRNADTFGFFALAVSHQSTPNFDDFEWSTGSARVFE
ncbi:MAG: lumenal Hsp70 protein [Chaenotheca gracillima]|nr:MAG: lumenal Hsp70 protein [Chaenotheca gracillima]